MDEWIGLPDACKLTGLDVATLLALEAADEVPGSVPHAETGRGAEWCRDELEAWTRFDRRGSYVPFLLDDADTEDSDDTDAWDVPGPERDQ